MIRREALKSLMERISMVEDANRGLLVLERSISTFEGSKARDHGR